MNSYGFLHRFYWHQQKLFPNEKNINLRGKILIFMFLSNIHDIGISKSNLTLWKREKNLTIKTSGWNWAPLFIINQFRDNHLYTSWNSLKTWIEQRICPASKNEHKYRAAAWYGTKNLKWDLFWFNMFGSVQWFILICITGRQGCGSGSAWIWIQFTS